MLASTPFSIRNLVHNATRRRLPRCDCQWVSRFSTQDNPNNNQKLVRLSKRMSELDLCSRREADRYILEGRVVLKGQTVDRVLGQKVDAEETDIVLLWNNNNHNDDGRQVQVQARPLEFSWESLQTAAVVLHKPVGVVSGQTESSTTNTAHSHVHTPAVRLLTPANAHVLRSNYQTTAEYQQAKRIVQDKMEFDFFHPQAQHKTLQNYVPAGRLDLDSSGLLIFTNQGVLAKKLISDPGQRLEKEYWVVLEPVHDLTRHERAKGMTELPRPNRNLALFRRGGFTLYGDTRPLRPVVKAEWLEDTSPTQDDYYYFVVKDQLYNPSSSSNSLERNAAAPPRRRRLLRIVLNEGRKHQIRRMCREILGMHVVQLVRTRIGPIELNPSLPEGKWRPLRRQEVETIFFS